MRTIQTHRVRPPSKRVNDGVTGDVRGPKMRFFNMHQALDKLRQDKIRISPSDKPYEAKRAWHQEQKSVPHQPPRVRCKDQSFGRTQAQPQHSGMTAFPNFGLRCQIRRLFHVCCCASPGLQFRRIVRLESAWTKTRLSLYLEGQPEICN